MEENINLTSLCILNISLPNLIALIKSTIESEENFPLQQKTLPVVFIIDPDPQNPISQNH